MGPFFSQWILPMLGKIIARCQIEPYRFFFPIGIIFLLYGVLLWLPQIWNPGNYPVLLHRYLVLNGFVSSFLSGFLMTAIPRFSKTVNASALEVVSYFVVTLFGLSCAWAEWESGVLSFSAFQSLLLVLFILRRIAKRQENPPYSFVFIFVGLILWIISALAGIWIDAESFKNLHYEGSIVAIILGVGSRLIPGIFGHVEIVKAQRVQYETPATLFSTVPWYFYLLIAVFVASYFLHDSPGNLLRALVVSFVALYYWKLYSLPREKSALTWCLWLTGHFILGSFILKLLWPAGVIHVSHSLFITGIVLLSLLVATRVIQSHGPKDKTLENWKGLYAVTGLIFLASATRVSAILMPEGYLRHLAYSSFVLTVGVLLWSFKYLRMVKDT